MRNPMALIGMGLIKFDTKLIDWHDGITTFLQRRGLMPLNTIKMLNAIVFWGCLIWGVSADGWGYFMIPVAAIGLFVSHHAWMNERGYWEDVRKTQRLNALVVETRDSGTFWRIGVYASMLPLLVIDIFTYDLIRGTGTLSTIAINYLICCFYIGPGNYAKDRKESHINLPQEM